MVSVSLALPACQRRLGSTERAPSGAGIGAINPFARRVQLDLGPYLQRLATPPLGLGEAAAGGLVEQVRTFYQRRRLEPAWLAGNRPRKEAHELVAFLAGIDELGLDAADYRPQRLAQALAGVRSRDARVRPEEVEVGLTWAALLAASDLRNGRVLPDSMAKRWLVSREPIDLPARLQQGVQNGKVVETLRGLQPQHPEFAGLLQAFQRYRQIARKGGWPSVPVGPVLIEGKPAEASRLQALARRLEAEGFLSAMPAELAAAPAGGKVLFPAELADAVRRFQATRTLEMDGKLGPETQAELNVPVIERLRQIALNLERWRWVPDDFGERAVLVNLPGYSLDVEEHGRRVTSMRVVVGEEGWETPVFADRIRYLVLNPYWNVPPSIAEKEVLPEVQRNPGYLAEHDMEIVAGERDDSAVVSPSRVWEVGEGSGLRLRARPGEKNPLGRIKFMFPNTHDIYLHDTPAGELFAEADRDASHGCIRLERPLELAEYLMRDDPTWRGGALWQAIERGEQREVQLPKPVPVYLLYFTVAARPDGRIAFYEDIYDLDRAHLQALASMESRRHGGSTAAAS